MERIVLAVLVMCAVSMVGTRAPHAAELVYFMSEACSVCDRWNDEIGSMYHKTNESEVLPLRTHSVHTDRPADLDFIKGIAYTPTFVVVEDGREVGRIVGYIADYFFWERVANLIEKTRAPQTARDTACPQPAVGMDSAHVC